MSTLDAALLAVALPVGLGVGLALDHYIRIGWPHGWYAQGRFPWERP